VGEHRAGYQVPYGINSRNICPVIFVNHDEAPRVELDSEFLQSKAPDQGLSAYRDKHPVEFGFFLFTAVRIEEQFHCASGVRASRYSCFEAEIEAIPAEQPFETPACLSVKRKRDSW
jgi:hypothetical protein